MFLAVCISVFTLLGCSDSRLSEESGSDTEGCVENAMWCESTEAWKCVNAERMFVEDCYVSDLCCDDGLCSKCPSQNDDDEKTDSSNLQHDKDVDVVQQDSETTHDADSAEDSDVKNDFDLNEDQDISDQDELNDDEFPDSDICISDCNDKECGSDGCGGSCGTCGNGQICNFSGKCENSCVTDCNNKNCGSDGCGGSCGTCEDNQTCDSNGQCQANCECSSGICCDGCNFKLNTVECDNEKERGCVSDECGGKRKYRTVKTYCSGDNSKCNGATETGIWKESSCDSYEKCVDGYCESDESCIEKTCEFLEHSYNVFSKSSADKVYNGEESRWVEIFCDDPEENCLGYINFNDGNFSTGCNNGIATFNYTGKITNECGSKETHPSAVEVRIPCGATQNVCSPSSVSYSSSTGQVTVNCQINIGTGCSSWSPFFVVTFNGYKYVKTKAIQANCN